MDLRQIVIIITIATILSCGLEESSNSDESIKNSDSSLQGSDSNQDDLSEDNNSADNDNTSEPKSITLLFLNVKDFDYGFDKVADLISLNSADVVGLCEVLYEHYELASELEERGISVEIASSYNNSSNDIFDDNVALYSRYEIVSAKEILTASYKDPVTGLYYSMSYLRSVLEVELNVEGEKLYLYVCHLKSGTDATSLAKRRAQAHAIEEHILDSFDDPASENIAIIGDMNTMSGPYAGSANDDWDRDGTMGYMTLQSDSDTANDFVALNYELLPSSYTYPSYKSLLDHIIVSPALYDAYSADTIEVISYPKVSDHYAVMAKFDFE